MGGDESHFNVSLIVRDKVTRRYPQTTFFFAEKKRAEADSNRGPFAYQPNALPLLGQTGSLSGTVNDDDDEGVNVLRCRAGILST